MKNWTDADQARYDQLKRQVNIASIKKQSIDQAIRDEFIELAKRNPFVQGTVVNETMTSKLNRKMS